MSPESGFLHTSGFFRGKGIGTSSSTPKASALMSEMSLPAKNNPYSLIFYKYIYYIIVKL